MKTRRDVISRLFGLCVLYPLSACNAETRGTFMQREIVLDVVLYSYLNRPIFDIYFNRIDLGVANAYGGTGIISGVAIPFGPQTLTWRLDGPKGMPRNGETVTLKSPLTLTADQIPRDAHYLGVHIYPDDTAELTFSQYLPEPTVRGKKILEGRSSNGK